MHDKENSHIQYKQISTSYVLVTILYLALVVMGFAFAVLYLTTNIISFVKNNEPTLIPIIILSIVSAYLIFGFITNMIILKKEMKLEDPKNNVLFELLTYVSLNIPGGIIMSINKKREINNE